VEVADGKQLGFPLSQPFACCGTLALRAMSVATAIEGDNRVTAFAVITACNMAAERRSPAALDRRHHLQLAKAHVASVSVAPSGTVVAEDIRDLQRWTGHASRALSRRLGLDLPLA